MVPNFIKSSAQKGLPVRFCLICKHYKSNELDKLFEPGCMQITKNVIKKVIGSHKNDFSDSSDRLT